MLIQSAWVRRRSVAEQPAEHEERGETRAEQRRVAKLVEEARQQREAGTPGDGAQRTGRRRV